MPSGTEKTNAELILELQAAHKRIAELEEYQAKAERGGDVFRTVFDKSLIGIALVAPDGRFMDCNTAYMDMLGYSREEILQKTVTEITHPEDTELEAPMIQEVLEGKRETIRLEKRYLHKNGDVVLVDLLTNINRDEHGNPLFAVAMAKDITENAFLREQERSREEQYRGVVANLPDCAVFLFDSDFRYSFADGGAFENIELTAEQCVGRTVFEVFPENVSAMVTDHCRKIFQGEKVRYDVEFGGRFFENHGVPIHDDHGKITKGMVVTTDVTERREAREALRKSEEALREQNELLEGLLDNIPDVVGLQLPDHTVLRYNSTGYELLGKRPEEVHGKRCYELLGRTTPCEPCATSEAARTGKLVVLEKYIPELNLYADCRSNPIKDEQGRVKYVVEMLRDISQSRRLEQDYVTIFNMSLDLICIADINTVTFTKVNPAFTRVLGFSEDELLGKPFTDFIHPEDLEPTLKVVEDFLRKGDKVINFENRYLCKDGSYRLLEWVSHPIPEAGFTYAVAHDVTKRRRSEAELTDIKDKLELALRAADLGIWEWDVKTGRVAWLGEHARLYGIAPEDFGGTVDHVQEFVLPEDREQGMEAYRRVVEEDAEFENTYRINRADGQLRWMYSFGRLLCDKQGEPARIVGITQDITESKRMREQYELSERRLRTILDVVPIGIAEMDTEGNILFNNSAYMSLVGYHADEVAGKNVVDFQTTPEDADKLRNYIRELFRSQPVPAVWKGQNRTKDGRFIDVEVAWDYKRDKHGKPEGIIYSTIDVTDRNRIQRDLAAAKEQAEAANKAKSEFLANMSHELRTPLNGILGMLQLLSTTTLDEEQQEYTTNAVTSSKRLTGLLGDILDLSRIDAGKIAVKEEIFEPRETVKSSCDLFLIPAEQKGIRLQCNVDEHVPKHLFGDSIRLMQVLNNLIGNSIKFTDSGSVTVEVSLLPNATGRHCRLLFCVQDTGIGISDEQIEHLFAPFIQADGSHTRKYQGAGLGLAIVKQLVGYLGGSISVAGEPGKGTAIYFSALFRPNPEGAGVECETEIGQAPRIPPASILVVEDDPANRKTLMRLLEKHGHSPKEAANGRQALDVLRVQDFDLVLLDIQLPEIDGLEVVGRIRNDAEYKEKADIPIIAVTAYAMPGDKERFMSYGMDDYLAKPIDMDELKAALYRVQEKMKKYRDRK